MYNYCTTTETREFFEAARDGNLELVKKLLKNGSSNGLSIDTQDASGNTALHIAAHNGRVTLVRYLVDNGATVSIQNSNGDTPLHLAANVFDIRLVKYLVRRGADITIQNNQGKLPSQMTNYGEIVAYFTLVTDFYRVFGNTNLLFAYFADLYFVRTGRYDVKSNIANVCKLLHLGSQKLADECYDWLANKKLLPNVWQAGKQWMYIELFKQAASRGFKFYSLSRKPQVFSSLGMNASLKREETKAKPS